MHPAIRLFVVVGLSIILFHLFSDILSGGSSTMVSNGNSATLTTTGPFGHKQVCKSELIGSTVITSCN